MVGANWGSHKKKFILDIDEEDADIHVVVEKPASIEDPKVQKNVF
jgi:hypothetical protein